MFHLCGWTCTKKQPACLYGCGSCFIPTKNEQNRLPGRSSYPGERGSGWHDPQPYIYIYTVLFKIYVMSIFPTIRNLNPRSGWTCAVGRVPCCRVPCCRSQPDLWLYLLWLKVISYVRYVKGYSAEQTMVWPIPLNPSPRISFRYG